MVNEYFPTVGIVALCLLLTGALSATPNIRIRVSKKHFEDELSKYLEKLVKEEYKPPWRAISLPHNKSALYDTQIESFGGIKVYVTLDDYQGQCIGNCVNIVLNFHNALFTLCERNSKATVCQRSSIDEIVPLTTVSVTIVRYKDTETGRPRLSVRNCSIHASTGTNTASEHHGLSQPYDLNVLCGIPRGIFDKADRTLMSTRNRKNVGNLLQYTLKRLPLSLRNAFLNYEFQWAEPTPCISDHLEFELSAELRVRKNHICQETAHNALPNVTGQPSEMSADVEITVSEGFLQCAMLELAHAVQPVIVDRDYSPVAAWILEKDDCRSSFPCLTTIFPDLKNSAVNSSHLSLTVQLNAQENHLLIIEDGHMDLSFDLNVTIPFPASGESEYMEEDVPVDFVITASTSVAKLRVSHDQSINATTSHNRLTFFGTLGKYAEYPRMFVERSKGFRSYIESLLPSGLFYGLLSPSFAPGYLTARERILNNHSHVQFVKGAAVLMLIFDEETDVRKFPRTLSSTPIPVVDIRTLLREHDIPFD